jgi:DNA-binding NarL/FixJ family response regulator
MKIFLVERSGIIASGLRHIAGTQEGWNIVGSADSLDDIAEKVRASQADVVILNPLMAEYAHRAALRMLFQGMPALVLVGLVYQYTEQAVLGQFDALIEIDDSPLQIVNTLEHATTKKNSIPSVASDDDYDLSEREREVLVLLAKGLMNKEIADKLCISIHTVISHRKNIVRKTGIKSVAGLTVYALLNNLMQAE